MYKFNAETILRIFKGTNILAPESITHNSDELLLSSFTKENGSHKELYDCMLHLSNHYSDASLMIDFFNRLQDDTSDIENVYDVMTSNLKTLESYCEATYGSIASSNRELENILKLTSSSLETVKDLRLVIYSKNIKDSLHSLRALDLERLMLILTESDLYAYEMEYVRNLIIAINKIISYLCNYRKEDNVVLMTLSDYISLKGTISAILALEIEEISNTSQDVFNDLYSVSSNIKRILDSFPTQNQNLNYIKFMIKYRFQMNEYENLLYSARILRKGNIKSTNSKVSTDSLS